MNPRWRLVLLPVLLAPILVACVQTGGVNPSVPKTEVDSSELDRRAAMRLELAAGYLARGQHAVALDEVKQALSLRPDSREGLNLRALVLAAMGETDAADEGFRRALSLYPRDPDTLHNQGWFFCQRGRMTAAQAAFNEGLAQPQNRAPARTWLAKGVCEAMGSQWADAERSLQRGFELDPGNPAIAFNLAEVLLRLGQLDRAQFYVARVNAQAETANAQSLWLAARIEHRRGNAAGATEWGERLVREFPQSREALAYGARRFEDGGA
ncbi:MAG: type IV pilus biogenesis/stability protein PilW [Inhella sp.]|jgi:type IV pilus assembly protein PilF